MNKIVKSIASVTLAFGTMLGVSTTVLPIEDTAHAATKPYYVYNGYVDKLSLIHISEPTRRS